MLHHAIVSVGFTNSRLLMRFAIFKDSSRFRTSSTAKAVSLVSVRGNRIKLLRRYRLSVEEPNAIKSEEPSVLLIKSESFRKIYEDKILNLF